MPSLKIIKEFQKEIGVERERFLAALEDTRGSQNAKVRAFYKELLDDLVDGMQEGDINPGEAERWMRQQIRQAVQDREVAEVMFDAMEDDFDQVSKYLDQRFTMLNRNYNLREARIMARDRLSDYVLQGSQNIGQRLATEIGALSQVYERDELYDLIADKMNVTGHRIETVTDNIIRGYNAEVTDNLADQTGLLYWRYEGTLIEHSRGFCRHLIRLGNVYTKTQILKMDNGHGLNTFTFRGGYNCRHNWAPGEKGWPGFERPYPQGAPFITQLADQGNTQIIVPQAAAGETANLDN